MFFGLDFEKLVLIGVLAALIMGPERLPHAAKWLAKGTVAVRNWSRTAKDRLKEEMGDDFDDVEWRKLDPRQYDPRRIVRDALLDAPAPAPAPVRAAVAEPAAVPAALGAGVPEVRLDPIGAPAAAAADAVPAADTEGALGVPVLAAEQQSASEGSAPVVAGDAAVGDAQESATDSVPR